MIKLIATDMDGTLLNSKGVLPEDFFEVFTALQSKNILFAAASGRQYFTLLENFKPICDEMLFIAENGTYIVYKGEPLAVHALDKEVAHKLIQYGRRLGVEIVWQQVKVHTLKVQKNSLFQRSLSIMYNMKL